MGHNLATGAQYLSGWLQRWDLAEAPKQGEALANHGVCARAGSPKNERCEILYLTCRLPIYVGKAPQPPSPRAHDHMPFP